MRTNYFGRFARKAKKTKASSFTDKRHTKKKRYYKIRVLGTTRDGKQMKSGYFKVVTVKTK